MKLMLNEKDYLEKHHLYGLIHSYYENNGKQPEYIIVHPKTWHKIVMLTNERGDDYNYSVIQFDYKNNKQITKIYGIAFIRSDDVEEDFIIIT